jgi:peptidoglycan DL-endopeptidase CwlO
VTPDTEGFLSRISTVQKVSENPNAALQDYQQAQANLAALEHSAETDMAALGGKEKAAQVPRRRLGQELDQAQKVPARLTADQQKQLAEAEKRATAKANAEGRAATKGSRESIGGSLTVK